ncbi:MAG: Rrf2 family transcriptional regulator [Deltaproteobacteria bacterium]|nr:Rrf2 family transcriptional regulator [Deltaproteobacteria bacterium]
MLHLNRKTEYALLALEHMCLKEKEKARHINTREVAEIYHIPYPLLAKVMQELSRRGFLKSLYGVNGGYVLAKKASDITVADIAQIFEGPLAVAECFRDAKITCPQWNDCLIKDPFYELNRKLHELLVEMTIENLAMSNAS